MLSTQNTVNNFANSTFEVFSSKVDLTSNKSYLTNAYGHKIDYYEKIEDKNNKIKRNMIIGTSAAFVGIVSLFKAARTKKINYDKITNQIGKYKNKIPPLEKIVDCASNLAMNFANIKDDIWDRFACFLSDKTPIKFVKKLGDNLTNIYFNILEKNTMGRLNTYRENISKLIKENPGFGEFIKLKDIDFSDTSSQMQKILKERRISKELQSSSSINDLFKKITSPIADDILSDVIYKNSNIIDIDILKEKNAPKELIEEVQKYNTLQLNELFPKLRDISCGSAPNDIVCASIPIIGFATALNATKEKEKRQSIMLNIGMPLIPTCLMPFIGLKFPILNGAKGMVAGFAIGQVVKQTTKFINNKIKEYDKNNKNQIKTSP